MTSTDGNLDNRPFLDKNSRAYRILRMIVITVFSLAMLMLAWWLISHYFAATGHPASEYFVTPEAVWDAFDNLIQNGDKATGRTLAELSWASLFRFLQGFLLAFALALPLGLLMGNFLMAEEFSNPWIEVLRPIAPIAWAPLFIFMFGVWWGPIMVVFVGVFFPLLSNIVFGVKKIDPVLLDAAKTLGASKAQLFYKVMLPSTVPQIMNGIRVGLGVGWMCIVAAEMVAISGAGIGKFILLNSQIGNWPNVFVGIIITSFLGILTIEFTGYLQKRISERMGVV